jgi:hypothetical protein
VRRHSPENYESVSCNAEVSKFGDREGFAKTAKAMPTSKMLERMVKAVDMRAPIGPTDMWVPGYCPLFPIRQQSAWRAEVRKAMRCLRNSAPEVEPVETPQSWWTRHLEDAMALSNACHDRAGWPRRKVPPHLRAAIVDDIQRQGDIEGNTVNELLLLSPTDVLFWEIMVDFRVKVAAYWVLREDARRVARAAAAAAEAAAVARAAAVLSKARASGGAGGSGEPAGALEASKAVEVLHEYKCPITAEIMTDPVCTADGFTYERTAIAEWLRTNDTSPSTGVRLACKRLIPNITVRCLLQHL